jgi:hypothetical protein
MRLMRVGTIALNVQFKKIKISNETCAATHQSTHA